MRSWRRTDALLAAVALLGLVALEACLDPTQATLVVTTNVECGPDGHADGTHFETGINAAASVSAAQSALATTTRSCTASASGVHDVGSMVIFPEGGAKQATAVVVGALNDAEAQDCLDFAKNGQHAKGASCIVARRSVAFIDHTMLEIPIFLDSFCAGVACDDGTTCVHTEAETKCVDDDVTCRGGQCDIGQGGGEPVGGAGQGGAGGGGGGGAGPGTVDFQILPYDDLPQAVGAAAHGVSADGAVVVGRIDRLDDGYDPVVWRPEGRFVLDRGGFPNGVAWAVSADGAVVVGEMGSHAAKWTWDGTTYLPPHDLGNEAAARDVDDDGNVIVGRLAESAIFWIDEANMLVTGSDAHAVDGPGLLAGGGSGSTALLWSTSGLTTYTLPPGLLVAGLSNDGTMAVGHLSDLSGFHVEIDASGPGDLVVYPKGAALQLQVREVAREGPAWRAVGSCLVDSLNHACVWDGTTGWMTVGDSAQAWPVSAGAVPADTALQIVTDISARGHVMVGWASRNAGTVAWKLTVPPL